MSKRGIRSRIMKKGKKRGRKKTRKCRNSRINKRGEKVE